MATQSSSSTAPVMDPNPAEPISELVSAADVIVKGTVESIDNPVPDTAERPFPAQSAVVTVHEVLKGSAPSSITVAKPSDTTYYLTEQAQNRYNAEKQYVYDARHEGIFVLTATGDSYDLLGHVGVHDDLGSWQAFDRVLAGLPESTPQPSPDELAAWAAQADIIVFADASGTETTVAVHTARADYSTTGVLTPIEVIKGEMPDPLAVVRGPQPDVPGGTWWFPVSDKGGQTGVYFIDTSSGTPTVINTTWPSEIDEGEIPLK